VFISVLLYVWSRQSHLGYLSKNFLSQDNKIKYQPDRFISYQTKKCLQQLYRESKKLRENPELAEDMLRRLNLLLPSKPILGEQRTSIHNKIYNLHNKCTKDCTLNYTHPKVHRSNSFKISCLNRITLANNHAKKIDKIAEEQEKKLEYLLQLAQNFAAAHRVNQFRTCIKAAKKFHKKNMSLLQDIRKTEEKLFVIQKMLL
jgi:hypothetical protein